MATTIVTKSGSGAPTASDLVAGELAVDLTNGRLYTEDSGGTVLELGLNPSGNVDVTGTVTADGLTVSPSGTQQVLATLRANSGAGGGLVVQTDASDDGLIRGYDSSGNVQLQFDTDGGDNYIAQGNVGIGTSSPQQLAHINGTGISYFRATGGTGNTGIDFGQHSNGNGYIWHRDSASIIFGTAATERMRIDSSGRVGIGTSSFVNANAKFVVSNGTVDIEHYTDTAIGYVGTRSNHPFGLLTNGTPKLYITTAGNVGIGTGATVNRALEIAGNNNGGVKANYIRITDTDTSATADNQAGGIEFFTNDVTAGIAASMEVLYAGSGGGGEITFNTAANSSAGVVEAMRIDENGNVGIGCTPNVALEVDGGTANGSIARFHNENARYLEISAESDGTYDDAITVFKKNTSVGQYAFRNSTTEYMRLDASGNLLVGKTSTGDSIVGVELQPSGALVSCRDGSIAALFNRLSSNGEVVRFNRQGVDVGSIDVTTTSTSYTTSSDQRLKENIADADDAGSKIDAIQVRKYDWKADGSHQDYGMIAQELQTVAPEAVSGDADSEEMMGVDYSKLVPMLIKEIQSLRNRVAQLEE